MKKVIKAFREGRSQRHAEELFGVPHFCHQRRLQSGKDLSEKLKGGQTVFNKARKKNLFLEY